MKAVEVFLEDEAATARTGIALAAHLRTGGVVHLRGGLGAGKTTLVRGILTALGHSGRVQSPSYTLVEPYALPGLRAYHLDLYRVGTVSELDFLGLDAIDPVADLLLVEWPEQGGERLPAADLVLELDIRGAGRQLRMQALSARGKGWIHALNHELA